MSAKEAKEAMEEGVNAAKTTAAGQNEGVNCAFVFASAIQTLDSTAALFMLDKPFDDEKISTVQERLRMLTEAVDKVLHQSKLAYQETEESKKKADDIAKETQKIKDIIRKLQGNLKEKKPVDQADLNQLRNLYISFSAISNQLFLTSSVSMGIGTGTMPMQMVFVPVAGFSGIGGPGVGGPGGLGGPFGQQAGQQPNSSTPTDNNNEEAKKDLFEKAELRDYDGEVLKADPYDQKGYTMPESLRALASFFGPFVAREVLRDKRHIQPQVTTYLKGATIAKGSVIDIGSQDRNFLTKLNGQKWSDQNDVAYSYTKSTPEIEAAQDAFNKAKKIYEETRTAVAKQDMDNKKHDLDELLGKPNTRFLFEGEQAKQDGFEDEGLTGSEKLYALDASFDGNIIEQISMPGFEHKDPPGSENVVGIIDSIEAIKADTDSEGNHKKGVLQIKYRDRLSKKIMTTELNTGNGFVVLGEKVDIDSLVVDQGRIKRKTLVAKGQAAIKAFQDRQVGPDGTSFIKKINVNKGFVVDQDVNAANGTIDQKQCGPSMYQKIEGVASDGTSSHGAYNDNTAKFVMSGFAGESNFMQRVAGIDHIFKNVMCTDSARTNPLNFDMQRGMAASENVDPNWCRITGASWAEKIRAKVDAIAEIQKKIEMLEAQEVANSQNSDKKALSKILGKEALSKDFDFNKALDGLRKTKKEARNSLESAMAFVCLQFHGSVMSKGQYAQSFIDNLTKHMYKILVMEDGKMKPRVGHELYDDNNKILSDNDKKEIIRLRGLIEAELDEIQKIEKKLEEDMASAQKEEEKEWRKEFNIIQDRYNKKLQTEEYNNMSRSEREELSDTFHKEKEKLRKNYNKQINTRKNSITVKAKEAQVPYRKNIDGYKKQIDTIKLKLLPEGLHSEENTVIVPGDKQSHEQFVADTYNNLMEMMGRRTAKVNALNAGKTEAEAERLAKEAREKAIKNGITGAEAEALAIKASDEYYGYDGSFKPKAAEYQLPETRKERKDKEKAEAEAEKRKKKNTLAPLG